MKKIAITILSLGVSGCLLAAPNATIQYCDNNRNRAVAEAMTQVNLVLPDIVTNEVNRYMEESGMPTVVTNVEYKETYYTNTIVIETSTTNTVYIDNVISNYWHTNYVETIVTNTIYEEHYQTNIIYTTENIVSNYWHTNYQTDVTYELGNSYTSTTFNVVGSDILYSGLIMGTTARYTATNTWVRTPASGTPIGMNIYEFSISVHNTSVVSGDINYIDYYSFDETSSDPSDRYRMYFVFRRFVSGINEGKYRLLFRIATSRPPAPGEIVNVNEWRQKSSLDQWNDLPPELEDGTIDYSNSSYYTGFIKKKSQSEFSYNEYIKNFNKYNSSDQKIDEMVFKSTTDALSSRISSIENSNPVPYSEITNIVLNVVSNLWYNMH